MLLNKQLYLLSLIMECCSNVSPASEECLLSSWSQCFQTGTFSGECWGPRDDKIVQFASHYFVYFPIFHLKYSYIFPIFCPSEFLYSYFFVKKVTGCPALQYCYSAWYGKARIVWLPDGEKILKIRLFVWTWQTDIGRFYARHRVAVSTLKYE